MAVEGDRGKRNVAGASNNLQTLSFTQQMFSEDLPVPSQVRLPWRSRAGVTELWCMVACPIFVSEMPTPTPALSALLHVRGALGSLHRALGPGPSWSWFRAGQSCSSLFVGG